MDTITPTYKAYQRKIKKYSQNLTPLMPAQCALQNALVDDLTVNLMIPCTFLINSLKSNQSLRHLVSYQALSSFYTVLCVIEP
jgi:hypothetical protein